MPSDEKSSALSSGRPAVFAAARPAASCNVKTASVARVAIVRRGRRGGLFILKIPPHCNERSYRARSDQLTRQGTPDVNFTEHNEARRRPSPIARREPTTTGGLVSTIVP